MDSTASLNDGQIDLSKLSATDKAELMQFVENETQKAKITKTTHDLTDICWGKCVPGAIRSGTLDKNEDSCMKNCVDRWLDSNNLIIKHFENMRNNRP